MYLTPEEREEIIKVVILMSEKLTPDLAFQEDFEQKLLKSKDNKLIAIYSQYKAKMKKNGGIEPSMWLSPTTYKKITELIAERKKLLDMLLGIKSEDVDNIIESSSNGPLLDPKIIKKIYDEEDLDHILANIWYYQLLNESQNRTEIREDTESVAQKINEYFPFHCDFDRHIYSCRARTWELKTPEERRKDLYIFLYPYLNIQKDKIRRREIDSD